MWLLLIQISSTLSKERVCMYANSERGNGVCSDAKVMTVCCLQLHIIDCYEEACSLSLFQDNLRVWNLLKIMIL